MPSHSRENSSHRERSPEDKENVKKKLSITAEEDGSEENANADARLRPRYGSDEQRVSAPPHCIITPATEKFNADTRQRSRPGSDEKHASAPTPYCIITPATEQGTHTPAESALLNNPLYHHIRQSVINDIVEHLRESQHSSYPPALPRFVEHPCSSLATDIGLPGVALDPYSRAYVSDPNFYSGSRRVRRSHYSGQQRLDPSDYMSRESLAGMSSSRSVNRIQPMSPKIHGREPNLIAITETIVPERAGENRTTERNQLFRNSSEDFSEIENIGERAYIPEFKWDDISKWPAFIKTLPPFIWTCIKDSFSTNPYKLHPIVYMAMGICLMWCIFAKWVLVCFAIKDLAMKEWTNEQHDEARRLTDSTVSILPYVVQLVLFLFPPLLASTA